MDQRLRRTFYYVDSLRMSVSKAPSTIELRGCHVIDGEKTASVVGCVDAFGFVKGDGVEVIYELYPKRSMAVHPTDIQALPLPISPVPFIFCLFSPLSLPLPRERSHSPYRWYVLLLWRIYWWMHCFASRYPGAHRSYGSFLILRSDSDEQEFWTTSFSHSNSRSFSYPPSFHIFVDCSIS